MTLGTYSLLDRIMPAECTLGDFNHCVSLFSIRRARRWNAGWVLCSTIRMDKSVFNGTTARQQIFRVSVVNV